MSKSDKREEIVRAAFELIAENGFHGAPMAMTAEHANVGAGTIYRYFENKDVLITELYHELEERIYPVILEGYQQASSIRERFLHISSALIRYFIENPLEFRYVEQFHNSPYGVVIRRDRILGKKDERDIYRELFEDGISRQVMKNLPLPILFALAFGPIMYVTRDHILGFVILNDDLINRTIEACWDGIKR